MQMSFRKVTMLFTGAAMVIGGIQLVIIGTSYVGISESFKGSEGITPLNIYVGVLVSLIGIGNILSGAQVSSKRNTRSISWLSLIGNFIVIIVIAASIGLITFDSWDHIESDDTNSWSVVQQWFSALMVIYVVLFILAGVAVFTECAVAIDPVGSGPYPKPGYGAGGYPLQYKY